MSKVKQGKRGFLAVNNDELGCDKNNAIDKRFDLVSNGF